MLDFNKLHFQISSGIKCRLEMEREPRDWDCPRCKFANFSRRSACRQCGTDRPVTKQPSTFKPGDWLCSGCKFSNFGSRKVCKECGMEKVETKEGEEKLCKICCEKVSNVCLSTCGHKLMCTACAEKINKCPACRKEYLPKDIIKVFEM